MMKYYYTYKGTLINVGDKTEDGEILEFRRDRILVRDASGNEITLRASGPSYLVHESPPFALYNRITGERVRAGFITEDNYQVDSVYADCARLSLRRMDAAASSRDALSNTDFRWLELAPSRHHVLSGLEVIQYPEFAELEQRKRELNGAGEPCVRGPRNQLWPASQCLFIDGHYRLLSDYAWRADNGAYLKAGTAGFLDVVGGGVASVGSTMTLTAGRHAGELAYVYDVHICADGNVVMSDETTMIRNSTGEARSFGVPDGYVMLDGIAHAPDSLRECDGDGTIHWIRNMRRADSGYYGRVWFDDHASECSACGCYFIPAIDGGGRCDTCKTEGKYKVLSYSNREANYFTPERDVPIKFGIELEVGCDRGFRRNTCTKTMVDAIGVDDYAVLKEDGSISECSGFEIVTRPDCPTVHKRIWLNALANPDVRKQMSSWSNGKCGIHIHVSRKPLSDLWVGRMLVLINSDGMQKLVHLVAGRGSNSYTRYIKKTLADGIDTGVDRYEALNTSGDHTIEFRIFRGTLEPSGFMKNIEFVQAVLAYCRPAGRSLRDIDNPARFVEFVSKSRKEYPALDLFLKTKYVH